MNTDSLEFPLVSFVIPTHNRANILRKCLDSVINQTYRNIEIIVVNDNSEDETLQILEEYRCRHTNFKFFRNSGRGGNAARNLGILNAEGEYIAFMDDDDVCEPFRIEEQMLPIRESNFHYNFVISGFTFNINGKKIVQNYLKPIESVGFTVRWLIKKEILVKAGLFDVEQPSLQDVEFFWRLKNISNIYFSPISVVNVSSSPISVTKNNSKMAKGIARLIQLHGNKMSRFEKKLWQIGLCYECAIIKDWKTYMNCLKTLNLKQVPFTSGILFLSYIFKNKVILKFQLRILDRYMRYKRAAMLQ